MNKVEAAEFLNISVRTLERHIERGELSVSYTRGSKGRERTFDREEVERFKQTIDATTYVARPAGASDAGSTALARVEKSRALQRQKPRAPLQSLPPSPITDLAAKLMLTREEAARFSGLPLTMIKEAISTGHLPARKTGAGWRVKRRDVETYIETF